MSMSLPASVPLPVSVPVHCNNTDCLQVFPAAATPASHFCGGYAVRTQELLTCPHCGRCDSQWLYAADVAPAFAGSPCQQRAALRQWCQEH